MGPIVLLFADERGNPADVTGGPSLTLNGPRRCSRMCEIQESAPHRATSSLDPRRWNSQRSTWNAQRAKLAQQPDHGCKIQERGSGGTEGPHPILNYHSYSGVTDLNDDHVASDRL